MTDCPDQLISLVPPGLHDTVANYWHDWTAACEREQLTSDIELPLLGKHWACSEFIARLCIRRPALIHQLLAEGMDTSRSLEDYRALVADAIAACNGSEPGLMEALRSLRQQEMLRIAWRDLAGADIEQVLAELSDFAEAMVALTLEHVYQQYTEILGVPTADDGTVQQMLVLAMGKLGGHELNFSSDIDLIFAYAESGETQGGRKLSNHEFFLRLARQLIKLLDEITQDGFVFRVDTRLRPNGESGPMAINFSAMEQYYQSQGRDWERYAMIKARVISGSDSDRQALEAMLRPFTYRRYLDFGAFESIREMKGMIEVEVRRKGMKDNIKLGQGGIREIEFIGQTFQMIRGGPMPELQVRSILQVLSLLAEHGFLTTEEADSLSTAYRFLRKLENRLQIERDQQTHSLPSDELSRARIALAMGFDDWDALFTAQQQQRDAVARIFDSVIAPDQQVENSVVQSLQLFWADTSNNEPLQQWLAESGATQAQELVEVLAMFASSARIRSLSTDGVRRLHQLLHGLLEKIVSYDDALTLLNRALEILSAIVGRPVYISLLIEYPSAQQQMLELCAASHWFAGKLARYPIMLDELLDSTELFRVHERDELATELDRLLSQVDADDLEVVMDRLRQFKRNTVFKLAATDVIQIHEIWDVGAKLSAVADVVLERVLQISWDAVSKRHGVPVCIVDGEEYRPGMAIIGYGKLGGFEVGYGSDLDIVFLHDSHGDKAYTDGEKSIDNSQFFNRVAQKVIHILSTRTHAGILYEVDTRLRPDGRAGLMVSSVHAFEEYQRNKAWTWEHQALLRARAVAGSNPVMQEFDRIRQAVLTQPRDPAQICTDVVEMREKMRAHLASRDESSINLKQDTGGMVDIEFTVQAGMLLKASQRPEMLQVSSTLEFLEYLAQADGSEDAWFSDDEARDLAAAYKLYRHLTNKQALEIELSEETIQSLQPHRERVTEIWNRLVVAKAKTS